MSLGAFLTAAAGPLARQVLAAIGVGTVTFIGLDALVSSFIDQLRTQYGSHGIAEVAAILAISGTNTALSIVCGALVGRVTLVAAKRFKVL